MPDVPEAGDAGHEDLRLSGEGAEESRRSSIGCTYRPVGTTWPWGGEGKSYGDAASWVLARSGCQEIADCRREHMCRPSCLLHKVLGGLWVLSIVRNLCSVHV